MKRFLGDASASAASYVINAGSQLIASAVVFRTLPLVSFGAYASALAVVSVAELAFLNRTSELALKHVGSAWFNGDYGHAGAVARRLSSIDWIGNLVVYTGVVIAGFLLFGYRSQQFQALILVGLSTPAQSTYGVSKATFIIAGEVRLQAYFEIAYGVVAAVVSCVAALTIGFWGVVLTVPLIAGVKTLSAMWLARRLWPRRMVPVGDPRDANTDKLSGWYWGDARQSVFRNALAGVAEQGDLILISGFGGPASVAIYKVAKSLASLPGRAFGPVWTALRPELVGRWLKGDVHAVRRRVVPIAAAMIALLLIAYPLLWVFGGRIINLTFGPTAAPALRPMLTLLVGTWVYHGATAWFRVLAAIDNDRMGGVRVGMVLAIGILVLGTLFGRNSAARMSMAVSASLLIASVLSWMPLFRREAK